MTEHNKSFPVCQWGYRTHICGGNWPGERRVRRSIRIESQNCWAACVPRILIAGENLGINLNRRYANGRNKNCPCIEVGVENSAWRKSDQPSTRYSVSSSHVP